jgi:hypothetical protein
MKTANSSILCILLFAAFAVTGRANQEYDWTGGAPGFSGSIVLDSNSNTNGTLADIVSVVITDPEHTFDVVPGSFLDSFDGTEAFSWNPSQITGMSILFDSGLISVDENFDNTGLNDIQVVELPSNLDTDTTGSWLAASGSSTAIPDSASTGVLVGAAFIGLVLHLRAQTSFRSKKHL